MSYATTTATVQSVDETGAATIIAPLDKVPMGSTVRLIYPASLHNKTGGIDESKLVNQKGNLTGLGGISREFDACTGEGEISVRGGKVTLDDIVTMKNEVCICKFHFDIVENYGESGPSRNFSPITINDGNGHEYTITSDRTSDLDAFPRGFNRSDDIYVAMLPVSGKAMTFSTVYGPNTYSYTVMSTALEAGKFYRNLGTIQLVKGGYTSGNNVTVTIPDGGTYTLSNANIGVTSGPAIQCAGNATIVLEGTNFVTTSASGQPAIFVPEGCTLTIQGTGSLTATANGGNGAGIGSGSNGTCGNIVINSGTITATGGSQSAGIGSGYKGSCGTITIGSDVTSVTATSGYHAYNPIGSGSYGSCGTVTIDGTTSWVAGQATEHFNWDVSTTENIGGTQASTTWTLTRKTGSN